jgi:hypothetical protein
MADGDVHTVPHRGGWANRVEGESRVASTHKTKIAAQKRGRELAILRKVEHLIHNRNGSIRERNSYGRDPASRPG